MDVESGEGRRHGRCHRIGACPVCNRDGERQGTKVRTILIVGGGYAGVEGFGELLALAKAIGAALPRAELGRAELPPGGGARPDPA
ncbi:hypothetical protein FRACA_470027 [Frankia canadensis]|uniref:FAD/NAD(P)-binding domain-containing protein n=1 Tax=Frankia canadensis TaxID=1836972 RepID=A0A2I2KXU4_9ACTN|nr:hypothetical protein FRACA_470027 [Frankia canadensis]SOU57769.1 hypothetical protein FRACA_470027 [Frankia canadensis]